MDEEDDPHLVRRKFRKVFEETGSVNRAMLSVWGCKVYLTIFQLLVANVLQYAGPICLGLLLDFYSDKTQPAYNGYIITAVLFGLLIIRTFFYNHGLDNVNYTITLNYSSLHGAIYAKSLHIFESIKGSIGAGRILNFISTDTTFAAEVISMIHNLWSSPLHLCVSIYLLYREVSWVAFVGVGMILFFSCCSMFIMGAFVRNRIANQAETDRRTKLLQEFLEGIRIIKYYAWEKFVYKRVEAVRDRELGQMEYGLLMRTLHEFFMNCVPVVTMLVVFVVYSTVISDLTLRKVYTVISLFSILRPPLFMFITSAIYIAQAKASIDRLATFFNIVDEFPVFLYSLLIL